MEHTPSWKANCFSATQKLPQIFFLKPESLSPHLQQPATDPYPEPHRSSLCPHPTSRKSILILSSHLRLRLPSGLLPSGFPSKTLYAPLFSPYVLHIVPISVFFTCLICVRDVRCRSLSQESAGSYEFSNNMCLYLRSIDCCCHGNARAAAKMFADSDSRQVKLQIKQPLLLFQPTSATTWIFFSSVSEFLQWWQWKYVVRLNFWHGTLY
jgi:hypothetical protein